MSLEHLSIRGVRNLEPVEMDPAGGLNWLSGPNGAGKTSIIEAIYLLARGRSFRTARIASIIQHGGSSLTVVARHSDGSRLGVEREANGWRGRVDGRDCQRISEFAARLPLVLIEPGSHALIDGGPDRRRQFLDWQLFHVEHAYLNTWQRFARLLRQRNAALKSAAADPVLDALEPELVRTALAIGQARSTQADRLARCVVELNEELAFHLPGVLSLQYRPGYRADSDFAEILRRQRSRDRELGFTRQGPHRAELILACGEDPASELSRGQQKLAAILLLLAQLRLVQAGSPVEPLLLLDDPVSELDAAHLQSLLRWLGQQSLQSWVTATADPPDPVRLFHVEQGRVQAMV